MNLLLESLIRKIGAGESGECLSEWANIQALGATMDKVGNVRPGLPQVRFTSDPPRSKLRGIKEALTDLCVRRYNFCFYPGCGRNW